MQQLDWNATRAMVRFKESVRQGKIWGTRCIVSMQRAAEAGLVEIVYRNGLIQDFRLTSAGEAWVPHQPLVRPTDHKGEFREAV